ncbi:UNVERIFIED_CONTAM: hypothetical protein FKN15_025719 [Acipenser sinensis]
MKTDTRVLRDVSRPLLFTLQTRYATTSKLQHWRTMQLQVAYRHIRRRLASLQGSPVCNDLPVHRNTQGAKTSRDRPDAKAHTAPIDRSTTEKEKTSRCKSVKEEDEEKKERQVLSRRRTPAEQEENKTQPGVTKPQRHKEGKNASIPSSLTPIKEEWNPESFLLLMKILQIDIPQGVITHEAIRLSQTGAVHDVVEKIIGLLINFELQFEKHPRLSAREVKQGLKLMENSELLELTKLLFFKTTSDKSLLQGQWQKNTSNTGRGFILSPAFRSAPVSTPVMHTGPVTRSWSRLTVREDLPTITLGTRKTLGVISDHRYVDEQSLWTGTPSKKGFGMFATNKYDELECLKWFHETAKENKAFGGGAAGYTCGNRVQYGFLTGNVDVFADFKQNRPRETQCDKLLIECKGTTGDMVGNFFTKTKQIKDGFPYAEVKTNHMYIFQVQTYMYVFNARATNTKSSPMKKAAMILRHYHPGGRPQQDFWLSLVDIDTKAQRDIDKLRLFLQRNVLLLHRLLKHT